jgi:hypothetical protein
MFVTILILLWKDCLSMSKSSMGKEEDGGENHNKEYLVLVIL